jgi:predicted nucleic acid-binding protein
VLDTLYAVPAEVRTVESLARHAWVLALDRRLTVYDACYIVVAEALDAPLVTADRRLAGATRNSVLITG